MYGKERMKRRKGKARKKEREQRDGMIGVKTERHENRKHSPTALQQNACASSDIPESQNSLKANIQRRSDVIETFERF